MPSTPPPSRRGSDGPASDRVRVVRNPRRGRYDAATLHAILDQGMVAHVGFPDGDGGVVVIPVAYVRIGDEVVLHAAARGRLRERLLDAGRISVAVTLVDGLVLARSAFHHSINYRSVVILGRAREVRDPAEKRAFLDALVERLIPGRGTEIREMTDREVALTSVVAVPLAEASAKIRSGDPVDDPDDLGRPIWAGVIPLRQIAGAPVPAADLGADVPTSPAALAYLEASSGRSG